MTTPAATEIAASENDAVSAPHKRQTIRRLTVWPPGITWSFGRQVAPAAADTLIEIEWIKPADGLIGLRLCNGERQEYGVELSLPPLLIEATAQSFKAAMTLAEIGELEVGDAAVQPPAPEAAAVP